MLAAAQAQATALTGNPLHTVAAAAMDTTGRIYTAVNDYHFSGGPCAELVVLAVAAAAQAGPLTTMVAVGDRGRSVLSPCGRCRQVIIDQHIDCTIIVPTDAGTQLLNVRKLLPHAYIAPDGPVQRIIRFAATYYDAVRTGRKTATTRLCDPAAPYELGPAWLVFEFDDGYRRLPAVVEAVAPKRFSDITHADAQLEGGQVADDLKQLLRGHYSGIGNDDAVDMVRFRVEPSTDPAADRVAAPN
ncbi:ASCH domain-containing protein [Nakamurella aerolata]|uniref:ASCH domain-containing protein n=1 Tax=Nakamurella aerolata TaxID=1656892 RepID=UPI001BB2A78F